MKQYYVEIFKRWRYDNNPANWENGCDACGKPFEKDETFIRTDVHVTEMRGDDEVFCFHKKCWDNSTGQLAVQLCAGTFKPFHSVR